MQQLVKQYVDSLSSRVISDEGKLSQLSQQCEPSVLQVITTPGIHYTSVSCQSVFVLLIFTTTANIT